MHEQSVSTQSAQVLPPLRIPPLPLTRRALGAWWCAAGGYREVLHLAWPLFLSYGSATILQFTDRMFLTWYTPEAMAAAGPSGMLAFTMQALLVGIVGYAATFVAQYTGAGKPRQAIAAVWQALYLSVLASLLVLPLAGLGGPIFRLAGHDAAIQGLERTYFMIFMLGAFPFIATPAVSSYFIGRGLTKTLLWISLTGVALNAVLAYVLIFGKWGFPEMGIAGAGLAAVIAQGASFLLAFYLFWRAARGAHAAGAWRLDWWLCLRVLRFGSANGLQFMLDMLAWTLFLLFVGRLGACALGATNLAFQLNSLGFFPVMGFAIAASTLVGQHLGGNRPEVAHRAVWSAIHLGLAFTVLMAVFYVGIPEPLLALFGAQADTATFGPMREMAVIMLRFVAAYCLFDVFSMVLASALKGAGDTLFVMLLATSISILILVLPVLLWCTPPGGLGIYGAWTFVTLTVLIMAVAFLWRYLRGHWRQLRVIEHEADGG